MGRKTKAERLTEKRGELLSHVKDRLFDLDCERRQVEAEEATLESLRGSIESAETMDELEGLEAEVNDAAG